MRSIYLIGIILLAIVSSAVIHAAGMPMGGAPTPSTRDDWYHPEEEDKEREAPERIEDAKSAPLVRVGRNLITMNELDKFVKLLYAPKDGQQSSGMQDLFGDEQVLNRVRSRALQQLVNREIFLQAARDWLFSRDGVEQAVDKYVDERLEKFVDRMGSPIAFREFLKANNVSAEEFRRMRKNSLLINEYLRTKVYQHLHVSPAEVERYYRKHLDQYRKSRKIVFRQLWVDPQGCANRQEEKEKAERLLNQIQQGTDFAKMANRHSIDRDRREGGLHEASDWGNLSPWLRNKLKSLEEGEVSGVVETDIGYCILKLENVVKPHVVPLSKVSDEIRRKLKEEKKREAEEELAQNLRDKTYVKYLEAGEELTG